MHHTTDWKDTINAKGFTHESTEEINAKEARYHYFQECPIYPDELISNLGIFLNAKELARILFLDNLYKQILEIPGVIMVFPCFPHFVEFMSRIIAEEKLLDLIRLKDFLLYMRRMEMRRLLGLEI